MLWKTGELIAPTVEYAADAAKDFHSRDTTVNTVCALPPVAFRFVNFFLRPALRKHPRTTYVLALRGRSATKIRSL
jgi:hypothetical protein